MDKNKIDFRHLMWEDVNIFCDMIRKQMVVDNYHPEVIIGLLRGGVIPARIFSDYFHILLDFFALDVKLYDGIGIRREEPRIRPFHEDVRGRKILIVDDIYESGKTMSAVIKYLGSEDITTATLLWKEGAMQKPNYYADIALKNQWIVFPWEKYEFEREMENQ